MMEKSVRSKAELKALSDTLTIRERYALDAYLQNKNDVGVRELVFEMTLTDRMIVSNAALRTRTKEFFKRNDVLAYIELKGIEEKERTMLIDSVDDDSRVKTYEEIIRELETERRRAKLDNNE